MSSYPVVEDSVLRIHAGKCLGRHDKQSPKHMSITPECGLDFNQGPTSYWSFGHRFTTRQYPCSKRRIDKQKEHTNSHFNSSQFGKALSTYTTLSDGPKTPNSSGPYSKDTLRSVLVQTNDKDQHSRTNHTEASKWTKSLGIRLMQLLMALQF